MALILSKFAIVAILAFAAAAGSSWHPTVLLIAFALLTIAAISPAALFGIVRFAEHSWHQRGTSRAMVVQTVSAAEQMRRTFMTHNPGHRIDSAGRMPGRPEDVERIRRREEPGGAGRRARRSTSAMATACAARALEGRMPRGNGAATVEGRRGHGSSGAGGSRRGRVHGRGRGAGGGIGWAAAWRRFGGGAGKGRRWGSGRRRVGMGRWRPSAADGCRVMARGRGSGARGRGRLGTVGREVTVKGDRVRHIFGQIERHTVFGDLRAGQRVALALALVGTIAALVSGQSMLHLALAGACATGGAWVAFGRVRGLAPADWVGTLSGHGAHAVDARVAV